MEASQALFVIGAAVPAFAGAAHVVGTLVDTVRLTFFAPINDEARVQMSATGLRLRQMAPGRRSDTPTIWQLWLGFNLSHGLGVLGIGALLLLLGTQDFTFVKDSGYVFPFAIAVFGSFTLIAIRFWFYAPILIVSTATACFAASYALA
ncbi:MAG: hypothetical protein QOG53_194 [Frankiales bacterium]|jgi:hypothetical protein|nr:hypothetical protein [Frankiales bacterium]